MQKALEIAALRSLRLFVVIFAVKALTQSSRTTRKDRKVTL